MKRLALILLLAGCSPILPQVKPVAPDIPYDTYADSLVRAYVIYEGSGNVVDDVSKWDGDGSRSGVAWDVDAEGNFLVYTPIDAPDYVIDNSTNGLSTINEELTVIVKFRYDGTLQGRSLLGRHVTTGTALSYDYTVYLQGGVDRVDFCFDTNLITPTCFGNSTTLALTTTNWYVFAGTYSNSDDSVKLYLNGVRAHSAKAASNGGTIVDNTGRRFMIGRFGAAKSGLYAIHYVYVWSRRLSDNEILYMYSNPYAPFSEARRKRKLISTR